MFVNFPGTYGRGCRNQKSDISHAKKEWGGVGMKVGPLYQLHIKN